MSTIVSPSILSCDFANLQKDVELINASEADWFHVDVMDGVFVPNISFGFPVIEALKRFATKPLDVHLMIQNPDLYVEQFKKSGADMLTVHFEACTHLHRTIQSIKDQGMKAGVAVNPHTNISLLEDVIEELDLVLVMSVNPGFGGQKFIKNSVMRVEQLHNLIQKRGSQALIEVDGGVNDQVGSILIEAGADALVAGNYIFNSENPAEAISKLKALSRKS